MSNPHFSIDEITAESIRVGIELARAAQESFAEQQSPMFEGMDRLREAIKPVLNELTRRTVETKRTFDELPKKTREPLRVLASNGWYLRPRIGLVPNIVELAQPFVDGFTNSGNETLCSFTEKWLDDIATNICNRFPKRARILESAFEAHRQGEYALSIPVFLAQADGICHEFIDENLYTFDRKTRAPKVSNHLKDAESIFYYGAFVHPLLELFPIAFSSTRRSTANDSDMLYRHAILHGESCDYDTRLNSCRALSHLDYIAWILERITGWNANKSADADINDKDYQ